MKVFQAKVKNLKTRYVICGDHKSDKVVLVLHGWGSSLDSWREFLQLPENNFACFIFFEFPGFGLTQEPEAAWHLEDFVDYTNEFQKYVKSEHNLEPNYILCHSFGGRVSAHLLSQKKHNFKAAVMLAPAIIKPQLNLLQKLSKNIGPKIQFLHKIPLFSKLIKLYRRLIGAVDYNKLAGSMKQTFENIVSSNVESLLPQIKVPVLLVWGTKDVLTPVKMSRKAHKLIPNSILKIIPGMTHGIHKHIPEDVSKVCLKTFK